MSGVRIDKWIWSVRIFKSRTQATTACKSGKVMIDGKVVKPSATVETRQKVQVKKNGFNLEFEVLKLIKKRVGAPIARTCYNDLTPEEELNKYKDWFVGKGRTEFRQRGAGRPTKRERREIDDFKENYLEQDWEEMED
ncbi:MAG: RNA-binding S4 domain-containing protein [Bacteroidetes bacterium]|nr:RNA-binding S4 domain-containing protein [Bacteroidota bacterium]